MASNTHSVRRPVGVERRRRTLIPRQQLAQLIEALLPRQSRPVRHAEPLRDHLVVHVRVLGHIQGREMEAEGAHAPDEAPHQKVSRMPPAICVRLSAASSTSASSSSGF